MKRTLSRRLAAILPAAVLLFGCQIQEFETMPENEAAPSGEAQGYEMIITADLVDDAPDTRTSSELVEGGKTRVYWSPGDQIKVFSAGESSIFESQNTVPSRTAKFKGTVSMIFGDDGEGEVDYIWGLYPNRWDAEYSEPEGSSATALITTTLPAVQQGKEDSFADETFITIGRSAESLRIPFKGVCTGVYITFENDTDIDYVSLKGLDGEVLAGRFTAGMNEGADGSLTPYVERVLIPKTEVFVTAPDGGTFKKDKMYYIITLPVKFTRGFCLTAHKTNGEIGTCAITPSTAPEFKINAIGSVKKLDNRLGDWETPDSQRSDEIWYTTNDGKVAEYSVASVSFNEVVTNTYSNGKGVIKFAAPISEIDEDAMSNQTNLVSVRLPDSVESLGTSAFEYCSNLTEVNLGIGLKVIGPWAFGDTNIGDIDFLPDGLKRIEAGAFWDCFSITKVVIPESVESIGMRTGSSFNIPMGNPFAYCNGIKSFSGKFATSDGRALVETLNGRTYLVSFATAGMDGRTYVVPDVDEISFWAFAYSSIGQVVLPESLEIIRDAAFDYSRSLTSVTIPSGVYAVCGQSFARCPALEWVKIESPAVPATAVNTRYYSGSMFYGSTCPIYVPMNLIDTYKSKQYWSSYESRYRPMQGDDEIWYTLDEEALTESGEELIANYNTDEETGNEVLSNTYSDGKGVIKFAAPVTEVDVEAFYNQWGMTSVSLPGCVETIKDYAFADCLALTSITMDGVKYIGTDAFSCCNFTDVVLPKGLEFLGAGAFRGSWSIKRVVLPQSLTSIGYDDQLSNYSSPFSNCPNIERFEGKFASADGRLLITERDGSNTIVSVAASGLSSFTVPDGIKAIGPWAFEGCRYFTEIVLPEGLEVLGSSSFLSCGTIESITIPASVTTIGEKVFAYNTNLKEVILKPTTAPVGAYDGGVHWTGFGDFFWQTHDDLLIYVPGNLLEYYQNTAPWSAYSTRYRAIE